MAKCPKQVWVAILRVKIFESSVRAERDRKVEIKKIIYTVHYYDIMNSRLSPLFVRAPVWSIVQASQRI